MTTKATPDLPEGFPLDRRGLQVGDHVRLVKLDDKFFAGLLSEDVVFLRTCIGRQTEVAEFDDWGRAEIGFKRPGGCHFLWVDPSWLEKV